MNCVTHFVSSANFRRINENEAYVTKLLPIKNSRAMAKIYGNPKIFSGVVAAMKSDKELKDPKMKYAMKTIRKFLLHSSYLITHRIPDLKKSGRQVWKLCLG